MKSKFIFSALFVIFLGMANISMAQGGGYAYNHPHYHHQSHQRHHKNHHKRHGEKRMAFRHGRNQRSHRA